MAWGSYFVGLLPESKGHRHFCHDHVVYLTSLMQKIPVFMLRGVIEDMANYLEIVTLSKVASVAAVINPIFPATAELKV